MFSIGTFDTTDWNPDQRALVGDAAVAPTGALETRMVEGVGSSDHLLVAMVSNGVRRYPGAASLRGDVVRNLILFDRSSGQGRRLFEIDAGEVGRMVGVDEQCATIREHNQYGVVVQGMTLDMSNGQAAAQRETAAVVALWGPPDERLGDWAF